MRSGFNLLRLWASVAESDLRKDAVSFCDHIASILHELFMCMGVYVERCQETSKVLS